MNPPTTEPETVWSAHYEPRSPSHTGSGVSTESSSTGCDQLFSNALDKRSHQVFTGSKVVMLILEIKVATESVANTRPAIWSAFSRESPQRDRHVLYNWSFQF